MGMWLDFLVVGNSTEHIHGPDYIRGDTEFIYNIIHRMGLYEYLQREQKTLMKGYYQDVGHIHTGEMWGMKEEDLHLKLKPYKEEYDSLDRYDQIIDFFMYIIEHQLDVFAG